MKALSLFLVLALSKIMTLIGRDVPVSWWFAPAYFWQDALIALGFGGLAFVTRGRPAVSWVAYGLIILYSAINVPLTRALSSPLTWQMSRAAGGALAGSITHYLNLETFLCFAAVIGASVAFPIVLRRTSHRIHAVATVAAVVLVAIGPMASARVETMGLERNAIAAFVRSMFPRLTPQNIEGDWRTSPFAAKPGEDLSQLRGAAAGRNVVLILLESTGARCLQPYGASEDPMPNLSRLAAESILFDNSYAVYPESIKGLFSVLCSRYPAFDTAAEELRHVTTPSLARVLADAGYRTALFHSGRFAYLGMESVIENRGYELMEDAGAIGGNARSSFGVDEPATIQRMLAWVDSLPPEQRFFLTYLPIAGHHPYDSPEPRPFRGTDERTHYLNALHYGDAALGGLLDGLKRRGLDTNTLFVIFGDHGEAFGQHPGNFGHTMFVHEENIHVPYLIAAPGLVCEPIRISEPASLIDTAPTILDLLGQPQQPGHQGLSLLNGQPRMALFYTDYSLGFLGLRDGPWKFIHELDSGRSSLFDLRCDLGETRNLAARFPARVAAYRRHLERWSAAQKGLLSGLEAPKDPKPANGLNDRNPAGALTVAQPGR